jgi:hypothetical protein
MRRGHGLRLFYDWSSAFSAFSAVKQVKLFSAPLRRKASCIYLKAPQTPIGRNPLLPRSRTTSILKSPN